MRPRREYSVAVIIGLVAMGLAMFGAGAALFIYFGKGRVTV